MNILNKFSWTLSVLLVAGIANAQNPMIEDQAQTTDTATNTAVNQYWKPSLVKDGVIDKVPHDNRVLPWKPIREVDVAWKRRVWERIDVRQKQNQPFIYKGDEYTGGGSFIEILIDAIKKGKIQAYSNASDRFTTPLSVEDLSDALGGEVDTVTVYNPITDETVQRITQTEFNVNSVTSYEIKEDWIFDRNSGRMVVRIIGIAPIKDHINPTTGLVDYSMPMFWLYYPDLRKILADYEVYNPRNDLHRMSWTDYLDGRYFNSYVVKTTADNPDFSNLPQGIRGLEKGRRLLQQIQEREMNMWED